MLLPWNVEEELHIMKEKKKKNRLKGTSFELLLKEEDEDHELFSFLLLLFYLNDKLCIRCTLPEINPLDKQLKTLFYYLIL